MVNWRHGLLSDTELLAELHELRAMHLDLGNPRVPFDFSEWGGINRQEAYAEVHERLISAIDEAKRRELDWVPVVNPRG